MICQMPVCRACVIKMPALLFTKLTTYLLLTELHFLHRCGRKGVQRSPVASGHAGRRTNYSAPQTSGSVPLWGDTRRRYWLQKLATVRGLPTETESLPLHIKVVLWFTVSINNVPQAGSGGSTVRENLQTSLGLFKPWNRPLTFWGIKSSNVSFEV